MEAAAELGRTLLERNRELESTVRQQQAVIDDQTQEMEVMKINICNIITREKNGKLRKKFLDDAITVGPLSRFPRALPLFQFVPFVFCFCFFRPGGRHFLKRNFYSRKS